MRKHYVNAVLLLTLTAAIFSCQKKTDESKNEIPSEVLSQIQNLGFSTDGVTMADGGYVVEGDIFLSNENLRNGFNSQSVIVAKEEHYRTTNLVKRLPRTISVSIDAGFSPNFYLALDECISRFNAVGLGLRFSRVSSGGEINVGSQFWPVNPDGTITLGQSAGFPDANGNPAPAFKLNSNPQAFGSNPNIGYLASVMAHEIGHAVGFRHTDYMNRAYSCGGRRYNEGSAGVGAIWIPGTPTKADANSWMLACANGTDRKFTANDLIALRNVYP
jgi:Dual-action HEIGH metallo-peptidase